MTFFKFLDDSSGIWNVVAHDKVRYDPIRKFRDNIMRGPSALSLGERELIAAFVSALNQCQLCVGRHTTNARKLGIDAALLESLVASVDESPVRDPLKPILRFVRKLTEQPASIVQADAGAVFAAGWDETALGDAIAICAYFNMLNRLADGHGLKSAPGASRASESAA